MQRNNGLIVQLRVIKYAREAGTCVRMYVSRTRKLILVQASEINFDGYLDVVEGFDEQLNN